MNRHNPTIDRTHRRPEPAGCGPFPSRERGLTLIELIVVLSILVVVAGIAITRFESADDHAGRRVTAATLRTVQSAILGTPDRPGYLTDVGKLPESLADLFIRPAGEGDFDPVTKQGWNGAYLQPTGATVAKGPGTIGGGPAGSKVPAVLDGWRVPIALQRPDSQARYWRLVSAGPDHVVDTPPHFAKLDPSDESQVGDDVVLYLTWIPHGGS